MRRTNQVKTLIAHQNPAAILMQLVGVYFNGQENGRPFLFSYGLHSRHGGHFQPNSLWQKIDLNFPPCVSIIFQMKDPTD